MRIACDFDGTITTTDTTDRVLEALADPRWRDLEAAWLAGQITAAECMRRQISLIGADRKALDRVLDAVTLDPGFPEFVGWCEARALPVAVVSDGVDYFIQRILARHGLERLPVSANRLRGRRLGHPWRRKGCAAGAGVCKCAVSSGEGELVYIGDGRSDFCVAARADILFAKGALAEYAEGRGQPFIAFETFHDVTTTLSALLTTRRAVARPAARVASN